MTTSRHGAVVYVSDLERMSQFYGGVFDLVDDGGDDDHRVMCDATFELVLLVTGAARDAVGDPAHPRSHTAVKPVFAVDDLTAARARVHALGGVMHPPERVWSFRDQLVCDAHDPEGNIIQLRAATDGDRQAE